MKKIVTLAGGLGNQMLQYSLYVHLRATNDNCLLYLKPDSLNDHHNFNIDALFPTIKFSRNERFLDWYLTIFEFVNRICAFLNHRFKTTKFDFIRNNLPIQVINFPTWVNYTFLNQIDLALRNAFKFLDLESEANIELTKIIRAKDSVSIHIRRGDYVNNPYWRSILGDICDLAYYKSAISRINKLIENPQYIIFSDDISWAKNNLNLTNAIYVNWNTGDKSYIDMQLMSMCKHNIIANSTFSLMAAWLNNNPDKIVICPSKWRNYRDDKSGVKFIPDNWIMIDNNKPNISIVINGEIQKSDLKNITRQSYADFEVLIDEEYSKLFVDDRIKNKSDKLPQGTHTFEIQRSDIFRFSDKKYINALLSHHFTKKD